MDAPDTSFWALAGPYLGLGLVGLIGVIWNGLRDKIKNHDHRLNNHSQRLTGIDGKTEDGE